MEFHRIWRILAGNKWVLIWLPIIATVAALGVTYVLPEQYESTALVLVRPFEDIKFSSGGGDKKEIPDFPVNLSAPIDALSKTYKEVINSPAVAMKIVDVLQ
ncbi:MAG: Wzz/FepE/Etk N-terminal domain-containing protein, partial [Methylocella sp.]